MSRSFTLKRIRPGKVSVALVALTLACGVLLAVSSNASSSAAAASCSSITLKGTAKAGSGATLKHFGVGVFTHDKDHLLGHAITNSKTGKYAVSFCKTTALATYAKRHGGRLSFDLVAHLYGKDRGGVYVRMVSPSYGDKTVNVSPGFTEAKVVSATVNARESVSSSGKNIATGVASTTTAVIHPAVMFAENDKFIATTFDMTSSSAGEIKAYVAAKGDVLAASGSAAIGGDLSFESGMQLKGTKKHPRQARVVKPTLSVNGQYTCYKKGLVAWALGWPVTRCVVESTGTWTGAATPTRAHYMNCTDGSAAPQFFTNKTQRYVGVGAGKSFNWSTDASVLGMGISTTVKYGNGTHVRYDFAQTKAKHEYCLGGNGQYVNGSSSLYVQYLRPDSGPGGCQAVAAKAAAKFGTTQVPC